MPSPYDEIIDELAKDPEFLELDPSEQDTLVEELVQEKYGKIPKSENILERAASLSNEIGAVASSAAFPFPQMGRELSRSPVAGPVEYGNRLINGDLPEASFDLPEAKTGIGKTASFVAPFIMPSLGLIKGGKSAISGLRTAPIRKEIQGIESAILESKKLEAPIREEIGQIGRVRKILKSRASREAEKVSFLGKQGVKNAVTNKFKEANRIFGEKLDGLTSQMADSDISNIIQKASKDVGAESIPGTPGHKLMQFAIKFGPKEVDGVIQTQPRIYNSKEVQAITKQVLDSIGDERTKAIFYKHLSDSLPESIQGLKEIKSSHAPIYKMAKESKELTRASIKRVGTGRASEPELKRLTDVEKQIGTNYIEKSSNISNKNKLQQYALNKRNSQAEKKLSSKMAEQEYLKAKIPDLERNIKDVRFRQGAVIGAGGLIGVGNALSRFFNAERQR